VSSRESRVTGHAGHGSKSVTHCHLYSVGVSKDGNAVLGREQFPSFRLKCQLLYSTANYT